VPCSRASTKFGSDAFGYIGTHGLVRAHGTNVHYMRFQFEKKLRELGELGGDAELRRRLERHVAEREELFDGCDTAVLCHDDCHGANVLVERGIVSGIVEWENAVGGRSAPRPREDVLLHASAQRGDARGPRRGGTAR
jgi:hypothetical protein